MALALRAAAACPGLDPGAFAFAILQTQSGSARDQRGQPRNDKGSLDMTRPARLGISAETGNGGNQGFAVFRRNGEWVRVGASCDRTNPA